MAGTRYFVNMLHDACVKKINDIRKANLESKAVIEAEARTRAVELLGNDAAVAYDNFVFLGERIEELEAAKKQLQRDRSVIRREFLAAVGRDPENEYQSIGPISVVEEAARGIRDEMIAMTEWGKEIARLSVLANRIEPTISMAGTSKEMREAVKWLAEQIGVDI